MIVVILTLVIVLIMLVYQVGEAVKIIAFFSNCFLGRSEIDVKRTTITTLAPIRTSETAPPRWRATNVEAFKVSDGNLASQGGVFADDDGKVKAIWMSFSIENDRRDQSSILGGLPARLVAPIVNKIKANESPVVKGLDVEFWTLQISNARLLGVSNAWIEKLKEKSQLPSVLYILGITDVSSLSGRLLKPGDIVLSINDKILTNISDLVNFSEHDQLAMVRYRRERERNFINFVSLLDYYSRWSRTNFIGTHYPI